MYTLSQEADFSLTLDALYLWFFHWSPGAIFDYFYLRFLFSYLVFILVLRYYLDFIFSLCPVLILDRKRYCPGLSWIVTAIVLYLYWYWDVTLILGIFLFVVSGHNLIAF